MMGHYLRGAHMSTLMMRKARVQIGRYAADHRVVAAVQHYQKIFPSFMPGQIKETVFARGGIST